MRSRPYRPVRDRAATALTSLVILVSSAGCSTGLTGVQDAAAPASAALSGAPSGAASPSPTAPAPDAPRPTRGPAGQEAFARYVMRLWGTSLRADDARPLLALAPRARSCAGCGELATELRSRARAGWYVDFPGLLVGRVRVRQGPAGETTATARVGIPPSNSYFSDGRLRSSNAAHPRATFTVRMRWVDGGYRLLGFAIA